jgi:hypothetical protein
VTTRRLDPNIRRSRTRRTNILLREGFSKTEISRLKLDRRAMDDPFVKGCRPLKSLGDWPATLTGG